MTTAHRQRARGRRFGRAAVALTLMLAGLGAAEAVASPAMASCYEPGNFYDITGSTSVHMPYGPTFKDGPGGSITASVTSSGTVSATGTVTGGATIKGLVAEAKVEVSASITNSVTITVGHAYTHPVTANKYGNMVYGAWGYQVSWQYYSINSACKVVVIASGTNARVPTGSVGWRYWETSS